jgi:FkbM family methyltransferase
VDFASLEGLARSVARSIMPDRMLQGAKKQYYAWLLRRGPENAERDCRPLPTLVAPGDHVIDVGANIGIYTKRLSELVGARGRVYSVEPIPLTFELLASNVKRLGLSNVELFACAISDRNGSVVMEVPRYASGGENFYEARIRPGDGQSGTLRTFRVLCTTLDALVAPASVRISFVKCDVEGHELSCIRGAQRVLRESKPALLLEVSSDPDDSRSPAHELFGVLAEEGYQAYWFDGATLRRRSPGDRSVNYFFLREEHRRGGDRSR